MLSHLTCERAIAVVVHGQNAVAASTCTALVVIA
jgi:hypothetical protein